MLSLLFSFLLSISFSTFDPLFEIYGWSMREQDLGWRPTLSSPYYAKEKKTWLIMFLLAGDRNPEGKLGKYLPIYDFGKRVFMPFNSEQTRNFARIAQYPKGEIPSHNGGEVFITQVIRLGKVENQVMYVVKSNPEDGWE